MCRLGSARPCSRQPREPASQKILLARHLPRFVRDAQRALELTARTERLAEEADIDVLTGLATRRVFGRAIGRLQENDVVILLDLDHFKQLNDTQGHGRESGMVATLTVVGD